MRPTLKIYGFDNRPDDFAVTKIGARLEDCVFLLDFSRSIRSYRWCGFLNRWIGRRVGWEVPVIHVAEDEGGYVIAVYRDDPYFPDIPLLWRDHRRSKRTDYGKTISNMEVAADFFMHFPDS
ncbi:MAG: hypothetical protein AB7Q00_16060 [Phycisphaerales bacterium]